MRLEKVFGVINDSLATYVSRKEIDECFERAFTQKRELVIYGSSKQGKTTLLNNHIKQENKVVVQCAPTLSLHDVYKTILKKLDVTIQSSTSTENEDAHKTQFNFKVKIPFIVEAGVESTSINGEKETTSETQMDVNSAQDIAEIIKKYYPDSVIILENFHYLDEKQQKLFAFDLRTFQDIDVRVVILGIWRERNRLTQYNGDLQDRIVELPVEPWEEEYLQQIISLGEKSLNIDLNDIRNEIISESFGNVGMLQELCKESCYDAHVVETQTGSPKTITYANMNNAIERITRSYASRFNRSLETFADAKPRSSPDGSKGLGIPYFFVRVILSSFTMDQLKNGLSINDLKEAIRLIHPNSDNMQFERSLTVFLNRISAYQKNHGITPSIFDYDTNSRHLSIVDPNFFFFVKHHDHYDFIDSLKLPQGYVKDKKS